MDVQHVTLLHTLRIFQDKKHLCSSQLHLKHYCTIHFSCALTNNTALFQSISFFFFGTEVGVESWSRVKSSLYFHSVGSAVRPQRLLSCSGGSADFLHRHIWLTCHTLCSWVPVSWHCSFPPLTVTTPPPPSEGNFLNQTEHLLMGLLANTVPLWNQSSGIWKDDSLSQRCRDARGARSRDQVQSLQEVCFHKCVHTQSKEHSWLNVKMPMMSD